MSTVKQRAAVFAALGDPRRLEIAEELSRSDRTPGELVEKFEIGSALLAHHLDVLEVAGLIERTESHADRRKRFVRLVDGYRIFIDGMVAPRRVTFVCRHNSARSQLAAALWKSIVGTPAESAGTEPATTVHRFAQKVAERHGLDMSSAVPRKFSLHAVRGATVITVCDQSHDDLGRPLTRMHWSLPDPVANGNLSAFETTYQDLVERITAFGK